MNNNLQLFEFSDRPIRTVVQDGEPFWVGKDVCAVLGYANDSDAMSKHCKGVAKRYPLQTVGGVQEVRIISESDLLRLIVGSKLPEAEKFERWVFEEVLPSIRRHGGYLTPEKIEEALLNPDTLIRLATDLKTERTKRIEAERFVDGKDCVDALRGAVDDLRSKQFDEIGQTKAMTFFDAARLAVTGDRIRRQSWLDVVSVGFDDRGRMTFDNGDLYDWTKADTEALDWEVKQ